MADESEPLPGAVLSEPVTAAAAAPGDAVALDDSTDAQFDDGLFDSMLNTILGPSEGVFGQIQGQQQQPDGVAEESTLSDSLPHGKREDITESHRAEKEQKIVHEFDAPSVVDWCLRARMRFVSSLDFRTLLRALSEQLPVLPVAAASPGDNLDPHGLLHCTSHPSSVANAVSALYNDCMHHSSEHFNFGSHASSNIHPAHKLLHALYRGVKQQAAAALHQHRFPVDALPRRILAEASAAADACAASVQITPPYSRKASSSSTMPALHLPSSRDPELARLLLQRRVRFVASLIAAVGGVLRGECSDVAVLYGDGNYVHFRSVTVDSGQRCVFATLASSTAGCRKALRQREIPFHTPFDPDLETEHIRVDADAVAELVRLNRDTGISVRHTAALRRNRSSASTEQGGGASEEGGGSALVASVGHNVSLSRSMAHKLNGHEDVSGGVLPAAGGGSTTFAVASALLVVGERQCCQLVAVLGEDALQGGAGALSHSARQWVWGASLGAGATGTTIKGVQGANVSCGLHTIGNDVPAVISARPFAHSAPQQLRVVDRGALRVPVLQDDGSTSADTFTTVHALDVTGPILPQVAQQALLAIARMQAVLTVSHQCVRVCVPRLIRSVDCVQPGDTKTLSSLVTVSNATLQRWTGQLAPTDASQEPPPSASVPPEALSLVTAVRATLVQAAGGGDLKVAPPQRAKQRPSVNRQLLSAQYRTVIASLAAHISKQALVKGGGRREGGLRGGNLVATTVSLAPNSAPEQASSAQQNTSVFGEDAADAAGDRMMALTSGIGGIKALSGGATASMTAAAARGSYSTSGRVSMATSRVLKAAPKPREPVRQSGRKRDRHTGATADRRDGKAARTQNKTSPKAAPAGGSGGDADADPPVAALAVGRRSTFHSDHGAVRCKVETHPLATLQGSHMFKQAVLAQLQAYYAGTPSSFLPPVGSLRELRFSLIATSALPMAAKGGSQRDEGGARLEKARPTVKAPVTMSDSVWHANASFTAVPVGHEEEAADAQGGAGGLLADLAEDAPKPKTPSAAEQGPLDEFLLVAVLPLLLPVGAGGTAGEGGGAAPGGGMSPLKAWCLALRAAWASSSSIHATPGARAMRAVLCAHFPAAAGVLQALPVCQVVPKRGQVQLRPQTPLPTELQPHAWLVGDASPVFTLSDGAAQELAAAALMGVPLARSPVWAAAGYAAVRAINGLALLAERVVQE